MIPFTVVRKEIINDAANGQEEPENQTIRRCIQKIQLERENFILKALGDSAEKKISSGRVTRNVYKNSSKGHHEKTEYMLDGEVVLEEVISIEGGQVVVKFFRR